MLISFNKRGLSLTHLKMKSELIANSNNALLNIFASRMCYIYTYTIETSSSPAVPP